MDKVTIIITGIFVFCIILLYILTIIIKNKKKKEILANIDRLTTEKNLIISSSLITEFGKANKLINNKKIASEVEEWKKRFDEIEKTDMPKLTDKLIEVESYMLEKNYAEAHRCLNKAEKSIFLVKAKSIKLLNEIKKKSLLKVKKEIEKQ